MSVYVCSLNPPKRLTLISCYYEDDSLWGTNGFRLGFGHAMEASNGYTHFSGVVVPLVKDIAYLNKRRNQTI